MYDKNEEAAKRKAEADKKAIEAKAEELKKFNEKRNEEYLKTQLLERAMSYARSNEKSKNAHLVDDKGTTLWDQAMQTADHNMKSEQNSYHDWRSSMMSLLQMFGQLNKAINTSTNQVLSENYDRYIYRKYNDPFGRKWIDLKSSILSTIKGSGDFDLPSFQHNISFKDGAVNVADLTDKDGKPLVAFARDEKGNLIPNEKGEKTQVPHPANDAFKALVDAWMIENDYRFVDGVDGQPGKYYDVNSGAELTEEKFNEIKPSFGEFLEKNSELTFEAEQANTPSP